jgi:hypothetical protein
VNQASRLVRQTAPDLADNPEAKGRGLAGGDREKKEQVTGPQPTQEGSVPDRRRRIVPEVVLVRRWVVGVLGIWKGEGWGRRWDKGVSLQAT